MFPALLPLQQTFYLIIERKPGILIEFWIVNIIAHNYAFIDFKQSA